MIEQSTTRDRTLRATMDRFLARSGVAIAMGSLAVATVTGVSAIYWGIAVGLALLFAGEFG